MFIRLIFITLLLLSINLHAAVPNLINYQGQLTDANGDALASDVYDLTFKIYDALTDGNLKWEETHTDIPVVKGFFNVVLGSNTDITPAFASANAFLEITVDSGTPITPRQQVLSSPYAVKAGDADTIGGQFTILATLTVIDGQIAASSSGVGYDSATGVVTFPNPDNLTYVPTVTTFTYDLHYYTNLVYLRSIGTDGPNSFRVWRTELNTTSNNGSAPHFTAIVVGF